MELRMKDEIWNDFEVNDPGKKNSKKITNLSKRCIYFVDIELDSQLTWAWSLVAVSYCHPIRKIFHRSLKKIYIYFEYDFYW